MLHRMMKAAGGAALVLTVTVASPAMADRPMTDGHSKHDDKNDNRGGKDRDKGSQGDRGLANQQRQVLRAIDQVDGKLQRVTTSGKFTGLDQDLQDALVLNVDEDRAGLELLRVDTRAAEDKRELREVAGELKEVRWQNYDAVVRELRGVDELRAELTELLAAYPDDAAVADAVAALQTSLDTVIDLAGNVTATGDKRLVGAIHRELREVAQDLEDLVAGLADDGDDSGEDEDPEDPEVPEAA